MFVYHVKTCFGTNSPIHFRTYGMESRFVEVSVDSGLPRFRGYHGVYVYTICGFTTVAVGSDLSRLGVVVTSSVSPFSSGEVQ